MGAALLIEVYADIIMCKGRSLRASTGLHEENVLPLLRIVAILTWFESQQGPNVLKILGSDKSFFFHVN